MEFSKKELAAMMKMGMYASASDGHVDESEKKFISLHLGAFTLKNAKELNDELYNEVYQKSLTISFDKACDIVREMPNSKKRFVCAFIAMVILADGYILPSELEFWNLLSIQCDLPRMSIEEARDIYKDFCSKHYEKVFSPASNSGCCLVIAVPLILVMIITMSVSYLA
jgi:hypothetical protein